MSTKDQTYKQAQQNLNQHRTAMCDLIYARQVPHSDVFRFRFIRGKSHAHSRKIWSERSRRSMKWSVRTVIEMPRVTTDMEMCRRLFSRIMRG